MAPASARRLCAAIALTLLHPVATHAARPMIADDARTVDAYACQVESWIKTNRGSRESQVQNLL
jgi:hypothetical protein